MSITKQLDIHHELMKKMAVDVKDMSANVEKYRSLYLEMEREQEDMRRKQEDFKKDLLRLFDIVVGTNNNKEDEEEGEASPRRKSSPSRKRSRSRDNITDDARYSIYISKVHDEYASEEALVKFFSQYGPLSGKVYLNPNKHWAKVTFESQDDRNHVLEKRVTDEIYRETRMSVKVYRSKGSQ